MAKCTDQDSDCAPQRLLRREGDVDLKERHEHDIIPALMTLIAVHNRTKHVSPNILSDYKYGRKLP